MHVSQLSKNRVDKPEDVVEVGDKIWVKVIGVTVCYPLNFNALKYIISFNDIMFVLIVLIY